MNHRAGFANILIFYCVCVRYVTDVMALHRKDFKQFHESSFCRFHRSELQSSYEVVSDSINIESHKIHGLLRNVKGDDSHSLIFEVFALQDKTVRLKVNELSPPRPRYEIPDGDILQSLVHQNFQVGERDENHLTASTTDGLRLVVNYKPFSLATYLNDKLVMTVNSRERLHVVKSKPRKEKSWYSWFSWIFKLIFYEDSEENEDWSETFNTHTDTRPYGPTSLGLDVSFVDFSHVYGIPEHSHINLDLQTTKNGSPYRLYNLDVFEYELNSNMALYGSVPFMIAHSTQSTVGMFWHNPSETWVDVEHQLEKVDTHWMSEAGVIDLFLMFGPSPKDLFKQYASLTGTTPLPPLFSLGYHQSRWNYVDENDVLQVVRGFDEHEIPLDVLWLDIEHTYDKRYFTFDSNKFPTPRHMLDEVAKTGRRMVTIIDPHLKKDSSHYKVYSAASRDGYLVKNKDGKEFEGWCWPGSAAWLDFTDPRARKFWAEQFSYSKYEGSTDHLFTWNDMNEPSVFNGPELTMHKDALHYGDREHREIHNIYGLYMHRSSFEGHLLRSEGKDRPFVLSRSFFSGSQKYGAVWTGDNVADWKHLEASLSMIMTLNLVGMTFSGADVGGFFKDPTTELLIRWYQAAAYQPFFRSHAHLDTKRREPYLYESEEMRLMRAAIVSRYRLLPYWYQLFYKSEMSGEPIMKPLWTEFPQELETFKINDEHMVGDSILVHPVTQSGLTEVSLYLPGCDEIWYDSEFQSYKGCQILKYPVTMETVPLFYRGGKVIPIRERIRRSSMSSPEDPYSLLVFLDVKGESQGNLYHDDFLTHDYRGGRYIYREYKYSEHKLSSRSLNPAGKRFDTTAWIERIYVYGIPEEPSDILLKVTNETDVQHLEWTRKGNELVIRKPGAKIDIDFDMVLTF